MPCRYTQAIKEEDYSRVIYIVTHVTYPLQDQFLKSRTTLLTLSTKFDAAIRELKVTCRAKTAVAVDQVYVS